MARSCRIRTYFLHSKHPTSPKGLRDSPFTAAASRPHVYRIINSRHHEQLKLINQIPAPADQGRLHSIACRISGTFLDIIPTCKRLSLSDSEFIDTCPDHKYMDNIRHIAIAAASADKVNYGP
jgi:hypothetical protein